MHIITMGFQQLLLHIIIMWLLRILPIMQLDLIMPIVQINDSQVQIT